MLSTFALPKVPPAETVSADEIHAVVREVSGGPALLGAVPESYRAKQQAEIAIIFT